MAIERHKVKSGVAAGNFGQAGTPLASVRNKVPNVDKLISGLMAGAKGIAQKEQRENTVSAQAAIREVNLNEKGLSKDERFKKMLEVKNKFQDEGFFLKSFGDENKAVQMIDDLFSKREGQKATAEVSAFLQANPDMSADELSKGSMDILKKSADLLKPVSDRAHNGYLKSIEGFAIQTEQNINTRQHAKDVAKNVKLGHSVVTTDINTTYEANAKLDTAKITTDLGTSKQMEAYHASPEGVVAREGVIVKLKEYKAQMKLATGSSVKASELMANLKMELAVKYQDPTLLSTEIMDQSGHSDMQDHGPALEAAEVKLRETMQRNRDALESKDRQLIARGEKERVGAIHADLLSDVTAAITSETTEDDTAAFDKIRVTGEEVTRKWDDGLMTAGEYIESNRVIKKMHSDLIDGAGDPVAEQTFKDKFVNSNTGTIDDYMEIAHLLSRDTKMEAQSYLKFLDGKVNREANILAQKVTQAREAEQTSIRLKTEKEIRDFYNQPQIKTLLAGFAEGAVVVPDIIGLRADLSTADAKVHVDWHADAQNHGKPVPMSLRAEAAKAVIDPFMVKAQKMMDAIDLDSKNKAANEGEGSLVSANTKTKEGKGLTKKESDNVEEEYEKGIAVTPETMTNAKVSRFRRAFPLGTKVRDMHTAIPSILFDISSNLKYDLRKPKDRERFARILTNSLDQIKVTSTTETVDLSATDMAGQGSVSLTSTLGKEFGKLVREQGILSAEDRVAWGKQWRVPRQTMDQIGLIMDNWHRRDFD